MAMITRPHRPVFSFGRLFPPSDGSLWSLFMHSDHCKTLFTKRLLPLTSSYYFQVFGHREDLEKHEKTETHKLKARRIKQLPKPVIQCEYCDLTFKSILSLDKHRSINHPGVKPYQETYTNERIGSIYLDDIIIYDCI